MTGFIFLVLTISNSRIYRHFVWKLPAFRILLTDDHPILFSAEYHSQKLKTMNRVLQNP